MKTSTYSRCVRCISALSITLGVLSFVPGTLALSSPEVPQNRQLRSWRGPLTPTEKVRRKTLEIVIPEVKFTELPLSKAAEALTDLSRESDKGTEPGKGVVLLVNYPSGSVAAPNVTIPLLTNFKLADVLNVICATTESRWFINGPYVTIVPAR